MPNYEMVANKKYKFSPTRDYIDLLNPVLFGRDYRFTRMASSDDDLDNYWNDSSESGVYD